ncbi:MAG TPA: heme o synthase [Pyrinomonadaceae bacterium]
MSVSNEILKSSALCTADKGLRNTGSVKAFLVLLKPEITLMVMISTGVASLLASGSVKTVVLFHAVFGTGLLAAGASSLNQYVERDLDGRMRRTARRPIPAGELTARQALVFGVIVSSLGMFYVLLTLNSLTALVGLLTLVSYVFIYTPLKTKTRLSTFVGAFPGAAPVLIGWSAVVNTLGLEAWTLYAILFLWQFPHFYAIGWIYREDYARTGMLMLPRVDQDDGRTTFRFTLITTLLLIIASLLFSHFAHHERLYLASVMMLGIAFFHFAYRLSSSRSKLAAKRLLHASVIYLPLLYLLMLIDRIVL